jgi:hypothetical protein
MAKLEVAFTSYSQLNNRDRYLREFIDQLRQELSQRAPGALPPEDVLFFDSDGIETGEDWRKRLSIAVAGCKVLVAICSPHFVNSEFCGKEVQIFLERLHEWEQQLENQGKPGRAIITVLWIKTDIPQVLNRYQFKDSELPDEYKQNDLRTLCQLKQLADHRTAVLLTLTKRILEAAAGDLPVLQAIPHFDNIASAFRAPPPGARYGVAVVDLVQAGYIPAANPAPFVVRNLVAEVCAASVPWRMLEPDGDLTKTLQAAKKNREAVLILADLPTLTAQLAQQTLALVDAAGGGQTALVIAGGAGAAAAGANQQLDITLAGLFPTSYAAFWERVIEPLGTPAGLRKVLSETVARLRGRLVREDTPAQATDPGLTALATAAGIPIERQPVLAGPGASP